jgi:hypothetical protein
VPFVNGSNENAWAGQRNGTSAAHIAKNHSSLRFHRETGAQRHWGGETRRDPATDLASRRPSNHPAVACGRGFPSLSKEGSLCALFHDRNRLASRTSSGRQGLIVLVILETLSGSLGDAFQHNGVGFGSKKSNNQRDARHRRRHEEKHGEHSLGQQPSNDKG